MLKKDPLKPYREKRDFCQTPEPPVDTLCSGGLEIPGGQQMFVIHKHRSRTLHYDLRLEAGGVLKCWAVPKGPSLNPVDKRLAIVTEDHPFAYLDFEGVIPEGEYGAGAVIVWDIGTYENTTVKSGVLVPLIRAIDNGHLSICLEGRKIRGGFSLTRTGTGDNSRWLLVKKNDSWAAPDQDPVSEEPNSVMTGRSVEDVIGETIP